MLTRHNLHRTDHMKNGKQYIAYSQLTDDSTTRRMSLPFKDQVAAKAVRRAYIQYPLPRCHKEISPLTPTYYYIHLRECKMALWPSYVPEDRG